MRLIDADKLIKEFLNVCRTEFEIKNKCLAAENVLSIIQNAPTVERPQGEWIKEENRVHSKCSVCGFKYADYGILFDYCPNCGADMGGGRE